MVALGAGSLCQPDDRLETCAPQDALRPSGPRHALEQPAEHAPCAIEISVHSGPLTVALADPRPGESGAECLFLGRTRAERHAALGELLRLDYEAHETMAVRVMQELARDAAATFGCRLIRIHHAIGPVAVGEISVMVAVATPHRGASFAACEQLIGALKRLAPIWKREVWESGTTWSAGHALVVSEVGPGAAMESAPSPSCEAGGPRP